MLFSQRYGYKEKKIIQFESVDEDLMNKIWNVFHIHIWEKIKSFELIGSRYIDSPYLVNHITLKNFVEVIFDKLLKRSLDALPQKHKEVYVLIKKEFDSYKWYEVFEFIEFLLIDSPTIYSYKLDELFNKTLKSENSGYRIIGKQVVPITNENELNEIADALNIKNEFSFVSEHFEAAIRLFSDKISPNYKNSIKESISAVESMCYLLTGEKAFGKALGKIESAIHIHNSLKEGFIKIYAYTSNESGIRHGMIDDNEVGFDEAKFMLVACSAFVNYLKLKESKITSQLTPPPSQ